MSLIAILDLATQEMEHVHEGIETLSFCRNAQVPTTDILDVSAPDLACVWGLLGNRNLVFNENLLPYYLFLH